MPPKQKVSISPGDRFGMLTVISECGRNKHGHLQYLVRCDYNKEYVKKITAKRKKQEVFDLEYYQQLDFVI